MTYLASSANALIVDRNNWHTSSDNWQASSNTWQGRANSAWGTSRVWGSGTSFESDLAAMTADRDYWYSQSGSWQSQAATWQGRANSAWGPSRVWGSGESWEQAYNRVMPANLTVYSVGVPATNCGGADHQIAALTVGITGQYMVSFLTCLNGSGTGTGWCNFKVNVGATQIIFITTAISSSAVPSRGGAYWQGAISAGTVVQLTAGNGGTSTGEGGLVAAFIPTPSQPH